MNQQILSVNQAAEGRIHTLIQRSHSDHLDLNTSLRWEQGVDRSRPPKRPDRCWLYGTRYYDELTEAQRHELLWLQMARDVSMFIWLEQTIPMLYCGYVSRHDDQIVPAVREYLMVFSKEEIVHTLIFRRYLALAGLKLWGPPAGMHDLYVDKLPKMSPEIGVLLTYLTEAVAEIGAMDATDDQQVDPLTREVAVAHHHEEARHIAFGRWVAEEFAARAPGEVARIRPMVEQFMTRLMAQYAYNSELPRWVSAGIVVPGEDDPDGLQEVRQSLHNRAVKHSRFNNMLRWLGRLGLVGPDYTWV